MIYKRSRLLLILLVMVSTGMLVLVDLLQHRFPIGIGTILFVMPCLLREWDLKRGRPPRSFGSFECSLLLGGVLWLSGCLFAFRSL